MTDYIKREDAIKAFEPKQRRDWYTPWIVETLEDLPSADVAPVRHGRWIFNQDDMTLTCGYCGDKYDIEDVDGGLDFMENAKFCLSCGARMDGGNDENL